MARFIGSLSQDETSNFQGIAWPVLACKAPFGKTIAHLPPIGVQISPLFSLYLVGEYTYSMAKPKADVRWQVRTTTEQQRRVERLMDKKALDLSGVINNAVKEMFDREIGEMPDKGRRSAAKKSS